MEFKIYNLPAHENVAEYPYKVYAHVAGSDMYIGYSSDPVKRWEEHLRDAYDRTSPSYGEVFKRAIRKYKRRFDHLILAVAKTEAEARQKEGGAVQFYRPSLNLGATSLLCGKASDFGDLKEQSPRIVVLQKNPIYGTWRARTDGQRLPAIAKVVYEDRRNRLRTIKNEHFEAGLMIECSRAERKALREGDIVCIDAALSYRGGAKYLAAKKTAKPKKIS